MKNIILSLFLIFSFSFWANTYSENINNNEIKIKLEKQIIILKEKLKSNPKFSSFVPKFEKLIPQISNERLLEINERIWKFSEEIKTNRKYEDILSYLEIKVKLEILNKGLTENIIYEYDNIVNNNINYNRIYIDTIELKNNKNFSSSKNDIFEKIVIYDDRTYFLINNYNYSEEEYNILLKKFNEIWKKCDKDLIKEEFGLKMICEEWKYWEYTNNEVKINYSDFIWLLIKNSWRIENERLEKEQEEELLIIKNWLKDYTTFKYIYINWEQFMYWELTEVWDECFWSWEVLIWWKWTLIECKDKKVVSAVYKLNNKVVSKEIYIIDTYNTLRKSYKLD